MSDTEQTRMIGATGMPNAGGEQTMVAPPSGIGNATLQMPAAGFDPARTQMGGTTTCLVCGTVTPLLEAYCGECGFLLATVLVGNVETAPMEAPAAELVDINDGRRYRLRLGNNTLGRQGTDILIMDATISRTHASIVIENGIVTITDLGSSNGTKVGETRLGANQPTVTKSGTPLKFGSWRCTLEIGNSASAGNADRTVMANRTVMTPPTDTTVMDSGFSTEPPIAEEAFTLEKTPAASASTVTMLQKLSGPGNDILLSGGTVTLGRKVGSDIVLTDDPYISGKHAELRADETEITLTDVGSTNGTVVNGQKLAADEPILLLEGDEIQIGRTKYRLVLGKASETDAGDSETSVELPPRTLQGQMDELRNLSPDYDPNITSDLLPPR